MTKPFKRHVCPAKTQIKKDLSVDRIVRMKPNLKLEHFADANAATNAHTMVMATALPVYSYRRA